MTPRFRALVLAAAIVTGACGGTDDEAPPPQQPATPICEAVLPGELQAFTGRTFKPGAVKVANEDMHRCEWESESGDAGSITLTIYSRADSAIAQYQNQPGLEPVEGVGDEAWWSSAVQTFVARFGQRLFTVGFSTSDGSHGAQAQQIVRRASERL